MGLWVGDGGGGWMFNGHGEKGNRVFMPFPAMPGPREDQVQCLGRGRGRAGGGGAGLGAPRRGGGPGAFFFFFFLFRGCKFLERGEGEPGKGDGVAVGGGVERGGKPFNDSLIEPV